MKIVFSIQNYDSNKLYVNTDTKQMATKDGSHNKGWSVSKTGNFVYNNVMQNNDYSEVLMQRKTEFYKLVDAFIADGYEDLSYYTLLEKENEEQDIELE